MKALYLAVGAVLAFAQNPPQLEVRGTVLEGALGIGGVTVTLYEFGHTPAEATTRTVFATTFTDATGKFTFHPAGAGDYYVEVKKEGYFAESYNGPTVDPVDSTGDPVSIDANHPLRERKFSLMRLGELRGRVIDEDGAPLANLRVGIRPGTITPVVTDQDGYFTATKLRPGDYQVSVRRRSPEISPRFSEEDLKVVDQDLQVSNWPGVPVPIRSKASLSVGTITARKTPYYRAHLSVQGADCAEGEQWMFSTIPENRFGPSVPCGKEFMVRNLAPGSYSFSLMPSGLTNSKMQWAITTVEVMDHNVEVAMTMSAGTDINGRVIAAEGATLPASGTRWRLTVGGQRVVLDASGNFLVHGSPGDQQRVSLEAPGGRFYVKEIRYNGQIVADAVFNPIPGVPGLLDIVVDDHAAAISGSVAEYDKASAQIMVVALKWPVSSNAASPSPLLRPNASVTADGHGRFQLGGLAPGEYRVLAIPEGSLSRLPPDIVNGAEKVTLERGGSQSVLLKIVEP
jgi:carboxypeptidase family protein/SdrD B-like protein